MYFCGSNDNLSCSIHARSQAGQAASYELQILFKVCTIRALQQTHGQCQLRILRNLFVHVVPCMCGRACRLNCLQINFALQGTIPIITSLSWLPVVAFCRATYALFSLLVSSFWICCTTPSFLSAIIACASSRDRCAFKSRSFSIPDISSMPLSCQQASSHRLLFSPTQNKSMCDWMQTSCCTWSVSKEGHVLFKQRVKRC